MSNWISVKDRMPDKVGIYLVATDSHRIAMATNHGNNGTVAARAFADSVTHWMPLPQHPEDLEPRINDEWAGRIRQRFERVE